jgi:hypothetical protein
MSAKHRNHRHGDRNRPVTAPSTQLAAFRDRRSFLKSEVQKLVALGMTKPDRAKHARGLTAAERDLVIVHQREISDIDRTLRMFAGA